MLVNINIGFHHQKPAYDIDLLLFGDFSAGDLLDFDEVGTQFSVNGSNQLVNNYNATVQYLGKDFTFETGEDYLISYDVISTDFDGSFAMSSTSMFGGTALPFTVGRHNEVRAANNGASTMAFRLALSAGTNGTQIVMDNFTIRKVL